MPTPLRPSLVSHSTPTSTPALNDGPAGDLTKFYSLDTFSSAVRRSEFDDMELVETIISHIRDPDPQVSLKGINTFQKERDARARAHGLLTTTTATITKETPDGTASLTFSGQSLADRLQYERSRARGPALHTSHLPTSAAPRQDPELPSVTQTPVIIDSPPASPLTQRQGGVTDPEDPLS